MGHAELRKKVAELKAVNALAPEEVRVLQDRKLRALLKHAAAHAPYYRALFEGRDLDTVPLTDLPVLTKKTLMARFDEVVTDPALKLSEVTAWLADPATVSHKYKDRWVVFKTSGTSGEPAVIVADPSETYLNQAVVTARPAQPPPGPAAVIRLLLRGLIKPWRFAAVLLTEGRGSSGYVASMHLPKPPRFIQHRFFNVLDPLPKLVDDLNAYQPVGLFATPSMLDALAVEQLAGRLRLRFTGPLASIATGGETLYPSTREKVRAAWGLTVQNTYGATECGVMAKACCGHDHLHLMSDLCLLEVVDADYRPVPEGWVGDRMLLTNLHSFTQPLIRYEVTDAVGLRAADGACGMPFPIVTALEGRSDRNFVLTAPDGTRTAWRHEHFLLFADMPAIARFQFVQEGRNRFRLRYQLQEAYAGRASAAEAEIRAGLQALVLPVPIDVALTRVDAFRPDPSGKWRMFDNRGDRD